MMEECDGPHYPKYMYEEMSWCEHTLYTNRDMKSCALYVK